MVQKVHDTFLGIVQEIGTQHDRKKKREKKTHCAMWPFCFPIENNMSAKEKKIMTKENEK